MNLKSCKNNPHYFNNFNDISVNGTTGEGPSLSVAERKTITEAWVNVSKKTKLHIMVQVGGAPLPDVIELVRLMLLLRYTITLLLICLLKN